ncbi:MULTISPECIES: hypothetical protein [unclassified Gemella]|uniref:hypothetical protein n=1 Tax=unclassified Gemella TaxID=2624949 RepID=UPI0014306905|nr:MULTISPECIES: hypothetical protein [unclassified Gemella]MBF0709712.1 hypothetical protein [Gemella sp. GL1.1]MBF0747229.1 hypothetical protein [Gemella sp. 19428wG2_WT2a]NYS27056.1 hypothetical protein [Gemella sp. GL1]
MRSRADYFKKRREQFKQFNVSVEKEKITIFEEILKKKNLTKAEWLNKKIDEEIKK